MGALSLKYISLPMLCKHYISAWAKSQSTARKREYGEFITNGNWRKDW